MKTDGQLMVRWAPLLALTAMLAACGGPVTPDPATTPAPAEPADRQTTCADSAIRLPDLGPGVHGAIVADTLHMGGATAPATCMEPANQSLLAGLPTPDGRTEQAQQSQSRYYLIVIRYPGGNRLYVLSRRPDGTSCVVDTNDQCIARVTDLPDDFELQDLPDDVRPTIPAGRPAPPTVDPPPGDDTPPAPGPAPGDDTPPAPGPLPGDGAPAPEPGTPPGSAGTPQPSTGATGVAVSGPLLSWAAASRALSYDLYWGTTTEWGTPINTSSTFVTIALTASLEHETLYYWRVDAKNEAGTTRGNVWSFTTVAAPATRPPPAASPPNAVWFPSPASGATNQNPDSVSLLWEPGESGGRGGARTASYDVYYGTTQNLAADADLDTPIRTTRLTVDLEQLAAGTTYYWRVDAKNAAGTTEGPVWSFTTRTAPAPPPAEETPPATGPRPGTASNPQPSDGATGVTIFGPWLNWVAPPPHASRFGLYVGTSQDLAVDKLIHSIEFLTDGLYFRKEDTERRLHIPWFKLVNGTTYYWRVDRWNENGITRGPAWSFTTAEATGERPGVSSNPQPSDGATGVIPSGRHPEGFGRDGRGQTLHVTWDPAPRRGAVLGYQVHVGTSRDLSSGTVSSSPFSGGICGQSCSEIYRGKGTSWIFAEELSYGTTYYWRVDAKNENGFTRGNVWSFTTCATKPHVRADGVRSCPRVETGGDSED